jgi:hypothetical protein
MSKRSRAETSAASSQPSTRIRVDESDNGFTMFDQDNIQDLVKDIFDGQLSDLTDSDGESELLSLSETEDTASERTPTAVSSGDWSGTRTASRNYRLPDDPQGPVLDGSPLTPIRLTDSQKRFIQGFCKHLILHWLPAGQPAEDRHLALADPTAFWHMLLHLKLQEYIHVLQRLKPENRGNVYSIL